MSSSPPAPDVSALAMAEEAHALVQADPRRAGALAARALEAATASGDVQAKIAAHRALGWAQDVLGDGRAGRATLRAGIRLAEQHGDQRSAGMLRRHLAVSYAIAGQPRDAQREIDAAIALLTGRDRAQSQVHRVEIHRNARSADPEAHRQVCADAARALRFLRSSGDEIWEARLSFNRGLLHIDRDELAGAEADLLRAHLLYTRVGADAAAVNVTAVLAGLALMRGDVVASLRTLEQVETALTSGYSVENFLESRVRALAQARLLPEARVAVDEYIDVCARIGHGDAASPATLGLAALVLMSVDPVAARSFASTAAKSFAARGKPVDAALARATTLRAQLAEGSVTRSSIRTGLDAVAVLDQAGWRRDAQRTHLLVARVALTVGSTTMARTQLERARGLSTRGTVTDRIELCLVRALVKRGEREAAGAERQVENGLRLLDEYQAALGAVELRATASGIGSELAELGLRIAIESGKPPKMLHWAERQRANALRLPAARPPADKKLRDLQTELRRAVADRRNGQQAQLETAIRTRARLVDAAEGTAPALHIEEAARLLGERALVEYAELDGALYALTLVDGELELHELGPANADTELGWLRFAFGRIAAGRMSAAQGATTRANADASAAALDKLLIAPLATTIGDRPLVIVPTGVLHAIPWAALPSLRSRPVVVAPSLSTWTALASRPKSRRRRKAFVAGPRLRHSAAEVRELAALAGGTALAGKAATAIAALKALDGAALAHVACHGHFRSDSPLFSSLELADGPLNVYELQTLRQAPDVVVLSACDLATSDLHPGDEVLGLAAALLAMGTRTIVASVVPVPDAAAKRLMLAFHRNLFDGDAPAVALARAQSRASVAGFVCLGSG